MTRSKAAETSCALLRLLEKALNSSLPATEEDGKGEEEEDKEEEKEEEGKRKRRGKG